MMLRRIASTIFLRSGAMSLALCAGLASTALRAAVIQWTDWETWDPAGGVAAGVITPSAGPLVTVDFSAITFGGSPGSYLGVHPNTIWTPVSTFISSEVENAPEYEALQLVGEPNMTYRVVLSEPIKDPVMAITTLGSGSDPATYVFDAPFTILSQGPTCCWGGDNDNLTALPGNILQGTEGAGTIQFIGTYSTFSWTVPDPEFWHAFTFGIRTTERLEPGGAPLPATALLMVLGIASMGFAHRWVRHKSRP